MSRTPDRCPTGDEIMTIVAARLFRDGARCFVGVGPPSLAACVARALAAPGVVLVYESGAIGAKPRVAPLSIADRELAETADLVVGMPELFAYWIGGGRIDMAFLGAAQIDRRGRLNTTVIGDYGRPRVRLPGGGGAPEIASSSREIVVIARHDVRTFVDEVAFVTTVGRERLSAVVTDLAVLRPDRRSGELVVAALHPGASAESVRASTGWDLQVASDVGTTPPPTTVELETLRTIEARGRERRGVGRQAS